MASRRSTLIVWLLASTLVAAQALLIVHDATPHTLSHTDHCQICAHGAGLGPALPGLVAVFFPPVAHTPPPSTYLLTASSARYNIPAARGPPRTSSA